MDDFSPEIFCLFSLHFPADDNGNDYINIYSIYPSLSIPKNWNAIELQSNNNIFKAQTEHKRSNPTCEQRTGKISSESLTGAHKLAVHINTHSIFFVLFGIDCVVGMPSKRNPNWNDSFELDTQFKIVPISHCVRARAHIQNNCMNASSLYEI